jgi:hypothetical protein
MVPLLGVPWNSTSQNEGVVGWLFGVRIKYPLPDSKGVWTLVTTLYEFVVEL